MSISVSTYTTLAKAGTKSIATGETGELEATIARERTGGEIRPAEALLLIIITLVGGSTRAGVAFLRAPVLPMLAWTPSKRCRVAYRSSGLDRGQKREERER
jgi:hypothetical protein